MNHSQAIKEFLIALATIAGKELNELSLTAYVKALSDLDQQAVVAALNDWLRTSKGFPYPADIRAKVMPEISGEDISKEVPIILTSAIRKYGNAWAGGVFMNGKKFYQANGISYETWDEAAERAVGPLILEIIKKFGGWSAMCEFSATTEPGTFNAQIRDYAQTVSKKAKRGELNEMPSLPTSVNEVKNLIGNTMNKIGEVK